MAQHPYPGREVTKFQADLRTPASFTWKTDGHLQFSAKWEQIRKGVLKAAGKGDRKIKEVFQEKMGNVLAGKIKSNVSQSFLRSLLSVRG